MVPPQSDEWGQLIYALQGWLGVETPLGAKLWYVPSHRALWMRPGEKYSVRMRGSVRLRIVYVHSSLCRGLQRTHAINVAPLLHEAILEAIRRGILTKREPLTGLITELLRSSSSVPLVLPLPHDARALRVAERLLHDAATDETLLELARSSGASERTLERLFASQTGLGFASWRQRLRMLEAMRHLLGGETVEATAAAIGYQSVSAFVVAFKGMLGESPRRWARSQKP